MTNTRSARLQERANGKFTVVAEVYDETKRAWEIASFHSDHGSQVEVATTERGV